MRPVILFLCVLCVSAVDVHAQAANRLAPLDSFVGGTWVAEGEFPGMGHYTAERTYRKILDGKFIEMHQVMHVGSIQAETLGILGWDPGKNKIAAWGFSNDGSMALTECLQSSPEELVFEGRLAGGRESGSVRGTFHRTGPDEFTETVHVKVKKDGEWQPRFRFAFSRRPTTPPPDSAGNATPPPELQPVERLVGTWVENVKYTNASYKMELAFHWVLGGRFLMSEYRVSGTANAGRHAISFIGYDADQKHLVQYGFNVDGTVSVWQITASDDVPELVFQGDVIGAQRRTLRITYRRPDQDTLTSTTEFQYQGIFQPADNVTMVRKGP